MAEGDAEWQAVQFGFVAGADKTFGSAASGATIRRLQQPAPALDKEELFYIQIHGSADSGTVKSYLNMHRLYVQHCAEKKQAFAMCYDFRGCSPMGPPIGVGDWPAMVRMHASLGPEYRRQLKYTIFLIPSRAVTGLINSVIGPLYTPVKPINVCLAPGEAVEFVRSARAGTAAVLPLTAA